MNRNGLNSLRIGGVFLGLLVALALAGCAANPKPDRDKPTMAPGDGAISGKLVGADREPFDVSLAGDGGAKDLRIELISPATGVTAATHPHAEKSDFVFSNVKPGSYELSVYRVVLGKRTIAGSQPVTVNPGEIMPVTLMLQVKPAEGASH